MDEVDFADGGISGGPPVVYMGLCFEAGCVSEPVFGTVEEEGGGFGGIPPGDSTSRASQDCAFFRSLLYFFDLSFPSSVDLGLGRRMRTPFPPIGAAVSPRVAPSADGTWFDGDEWEALLSR